MVTTKERCEALRERYDALTKMYEGGAVQVWFLPRVNEEPVLHANRWCSSIRDSAREVKHGSVTELAYVSARRCSRCKERQSRDYVSWQHELRVVAGGVEWLGAGSSDSPGVRLGDGRAVLASIARAREYLDVLGGEQGARGRAVRALAELSDEVEAEVCSAVSTLAHEAVRLSEADLCSLRARILEGDQSEWSLQEASQLQRQLREAGLAGCIRDEEYVLQVILGDVLRDVAEDGSADLRALCEAAVAHHTEVPDPSVNHLVPTRLDPGAHTRDGVLDLQSFARAAWEDASTSARALLTEGVWGVLEQRLRAGEESHEPVLLICEEYLYAYHSGNSLEVELERFQVVGEHQGLSAHVVPRILGELARAHLASEVVVAEVVESEPSSVYCLALQLAEGSLEAVESSLQSARDAHA